MFKNKLNSFVIFEILKSYLLVLITLSILIWITQAAKYLNFITEAGLSINIYLNYIFLIFPKITSQLMIISFVISLFLTLLKLLDNKEIEIFWLSGISKIKISLLILKISFIPTVLCLFFYIYLVPQTNFKSRLILAKSEFSMVNSLVKKNNFNSPLKNLTIFVNKNDNKGNLENVYVFEEYKTIIAKKGRVVNINNKNYLELIDGIIHEKNRKNKNIEVVKFKKTIFDFTKYQTEITKYTKLQEQTTYWLFQQYLTLKKDPNILEEIHKRVFKPLFIPILSFLCCFLLYTNNEKINLTRLKIFIFSVCTVLVILIEILINLSVKYSSIQFILYFFPTLGLLFIFILLKNFLNSEPTNKK